VIELRFLIDYQGNSEYKSKNYAKCCLNLNEYEVFAH